MGVYKTMKKIVIEKYLMMELSDSNLISNKWLPL